MYSRLHVALAFLIALAYSTVEAAGSQQRPPNILVFLVDDLGATDLGCFGSTFYETPNVDRLAATGMRFTAAYSACPVCSPTRASMLTGRYPQRTSITDFIGARQPEGWNRNTKLLPAPYSDHLALEERTIAEVLSDGGYATFFAGKWHLGGRGFLPTDQGFSINKGGFNAGSPRSYFSPYGNPYLKDGPPGEHLPLRLAEETCRFIETTADRPFFAYLSFYSVHIPLQTTAELIKKYEAKTETVHLNGRLFGREHTIRARLVQNHPTYAGMIESMDKGVGMVLDKLESLHLTENTFVVFTSDNGGLATAEGCPTTNLPLRAGKGWLYEGGIRVPAIIRWPGVTQPNSTCASPIISNDYFPTLCEVTGQPPRSKSKIDGVSLVPALRGRELPKRSLYWDYPHYGNQGGAPGSVVRESHWKLIDWREDEHLELFDLSADPGEKTNLAEKKPDLVSRLKNDLDNWRREVGATSPTPNPNYDARQ